MSVVIDASVALKWVLGEADSEKADALLDEALIAPNIWLAEAANVLRRSVRIGDLADDQARARLRELQNAPVVSMSIEPDLYHALTLAFELRHPVYDCLYLALALRHDTHVVTADRRFAAAAERAGMAGRVKLLSD